MVDFSQYQEQIERDREELAAEEREAGAEKDQAFVVLRNGIGRALEVDFKSFQVFRDLSTDDIQNKIHQLAEALANEPNRIARAYAVHFLLFTHDDLSFEALEALFRNLPVDEDSAEARSEIADHLSRLVNSGNALRFIELVKVTPSGPEKATLLYGFEKIKDAGYEKQMKVILKEALHYPPFAWVSAEIAKKKKYHELLPDIEDALPRASNGETRRIIQRSIDYLKSHA